MPGRKYQQDGYRYGFNGKEKDDGFNNLMSYDYGFRIYNPAIGRFLSVDPLTESYPWYTPYQFAGNTPIMAVDLDGLEESPSTSIKAGAPALHVVVEKAVEQSTKQTAKIIVMKTTEKVAERSIWSILGGVALRVGGVIGGLLYSNPAGGGFAPGQAPYERFRTNPQSEPNATPTASPVPNPRQKPEPEENGDEGYYVYRTFSSDKIISGIVDKSAGTLPYYGITKDKIIGGRYASTNERAINLEKPGNGIIAKTDYYTAGGIESAIIILNTYGVSMLRTDKLSELQRSAPALATTVDNKTITYTDPARIMSGVIWLNTHIPNWLKILKEPENKTGPNHPDNAQNTNSNNSAATTENGDCTNQPPTQ